jgi:hypothetical protein
MVSTGLALQCSVWSIEEQGLVLWYPSQDGGIMVKLAQLFERGNRTDLRGSGMSCCLDLFVNQPGSACTIAYCLVRGAGLL